MKPLKKRVWVAFVGLSLFCNPALHAQVIFSCTNGMGPNLVPNPGFESYTICPTGFSQLYVAAPWFEPSFGTSDYFNPCANNGLGAGLVGVPDNFAGSQMPYDGQAYAGAYTFYEEGIIYREYVETPLSFPLAAGHTYNISFWVALASMSSCAVDNIGAYLSVDPITLPAGAYGNLPVIPQVRNPAGNFLTSPNWTLVQGTYTATGGESCLTIGNFANNTNTPTEPGTNRDEAVSYYYIDDVTVSDTAPCNTCTNGSITITSPADITLAICSNSVAIPYLVSYTDTACPNCATLVSDPPSGSYFLPGTTVVTNTVTDSLGNTDICTFDVTVIAETNPPVVTDYPSSVVACIPPNSNHSFMPDLTSQVQAYNPTGHGVVITQSIPAQTPLYDSTNAIITVADQCGNATNLNVFCLVKSCCIQVECPSNMIVTTCSNATPVLFSVGVVDHCCSNNCYTLVSSPPSGSVFHLGTTIVTNTATDLAGGTDVCEFAITVLQDTDTIPFNCLTNDLVYVHADTNGCGLVPDETAKLKAINQDMVTVTQNLAAGSSICSQTNLTLTALDACGQTHECDVQLALISDLALTYDHNHLSINWGNLPDLQLQWSTDLFRWQVVPGTPLSPFVITNSLQMAPSQFYRLMFRTN